MDNFARAVALALRYRLTLAGVLVSSLAVALLWGANIGAVYPIVEVLFRGQSLQTWVSESVAHSDQTTAKLNTDVAQIQTELASAAEADRWRLQARLETTQHLLTVEASTRATLVWIQPWIDAWLPSQPFQTLAVIVAFVFAASLVKDVFLLVSSLLVERLANLATLDLRTQFFRRTLRMDVATFGEDRTSSLMARFTSDVEAVRNGLINLFGHSIREPLKAVACLVGAAIICWPLLLVSLVIMPIAVVVVHMLTVALRRATRQALEEIAELYGVLSESFGGIEAVKAYTMERRERKRFHQSSKRWYHRLMRIALYSALTKPAMEMMGIAVICLALLVGAYLVLNQQTTLFGIWMSDRPLSLGALMVFYGMLAGAADPVRRMTEIWAFVQKGAVAADRVYEFFDREPLVANPAHPKPMPEGFRELVFENVHFHYTPDQPVLRDINLRLAGNESVAIVGPNGCGKTTLARMILRFYDPVSGHIRINDTDLRDVRLRELRGTMGLVSQQAQLFDDTVLENIRYGSPYATDEEVIAAAKQAHAHRFIEEKLLDGYATVVGTGGGKLSGGQRQRIALARAILRDPRILILDEATSQVDLESEQALHQVLSTFTRGRLSVIITHRLATLALADRIIVMDAGRILDVGTHDELSRRCTLYRRLHDLQFSQKAI